MVLLDEHGGPGGRVASLAHSDPTARRAQYRAADDEPVAGTWPGLSLTARSPTCGSRCCAPGRRVPDPVVTSAAETLAITRLLLADATSYDGTARPRRDGDARVLPCLAEVIGETWGFTARQRCPPPDPVNAMLSFGYTHARRRRLVAALESAGLDAAVGFLHHARWGRPSLALDLMEEFRSVVVNSVVLRCLSTGIIRFEEFDTAPGVGCRMNARARQAFLAAYERRMLTIFTHEPTGRRVSYRVGVGLQARALARAILGPRTHLPPVRRK